MIVGDVQGDNSLVHVQIAFEYKCCYVHVNVIVGDVQGDNSLVHVLMILISV